MSFGLSRLLLVILFSAPPPAAHAEHGSPLLLVKPGDRAAIPRNAQIRLVSYNGEHQLIWLLGRSPRKVRATLESANSVVALRPGRYFTDHDGYGRAMISLVSGRLLKPETEYRLVVDVPTEDWRMELATFVTTTEIDRAAPRWTSEPVFRREDRTIVGRLANYDDIIEVDFIVRPKAGGKARKTFILFDLAQKCIQGPTADYYVAIYNSQCLDDEDQKLQDAICDTLYYFSGWLTDGAEYVVRVELRDLAGNLRRLSMVAGSIDLDEPFGLCLDKGSGDF